MLIDVTIYPNAHDFTALLDGKCQSKRKGNISVITPHHVAGVVQGENGVKNICSMWKKRGASTNYIIDVKGKAYLVVPHGNRSWASSNSANDDKAITFEMSNDKAKYPWSISGETLETAIDLTAWTCARYGILPAYDGTRNASITIHRFFAATQCPGDYFIKEMLNTGVFVRRVLERKIQWEMRLNGQISIPSPIGDKPNDGKYYVQIGAYKSKANAVKQAGKASGYSVIHIPNDDAYYVRKTCNVDELENELAKARQITHRAFTGVYNKSQYQVIQGGA